MEEAIVQERPGIVSRIAGLFSRTEVIEEEEIVERVPEATSTVRLSRQYSYTVRVNTAVESLRDAMAVANGLKGGDAQVVNLENTPDAERRDIINFLCGVNYAVEGRMEMLSQNVYLLVPSHAHIQHVPPTATSQSPFN